VFLEAEGGWDDDISYYDGPLLHNGVEQFFSLEEEMHVEEANKNLKPVESSPEIQKIIEAVHNAYTGHSGVRRTLARLHKQGVSFKHMREHVTKYITECPLCQKLSTKAGPPTQSLPFTLASHGVMSRLYIDSIGPLTMDEEGYQHILVVIDAFTRWIMLYPLKSLQAKECAQWLMFHFGTFGAASQLTSDGGTQVNNALINEILSLVGAKHKVTTAYSHEENGIVERANKEIGRHLRGFLFEQTVGDTWRTYLPFVQRICNTEVVESIGVSPASILFGSAVQLDRGVFMPNQIYEAHEHGNLAEYTNSLIAAQKATIEYASTRQLQKDRAHISSATAAITEVTSFKVGDYVLCDYPSGGFTKRALPPNKLMTNLMGPLIVVSNSGSTYSLLNPATGREVISHVTRIRPFLHDPLRTNPTAVCAKDTDQWLVDRVIRHRGYNPQSKVIYDWTGKGTSKKVSELQLEVRWIGSTEVTWENWTGNLISNIRAYEYMRSFPHLNRLIPQHFQDAHAAHFQTEAHQP
jgi:Integrase zinc binding domain